MNSYEEWARAYPEAAQALERTVNAFPWPRPGEGEGEGEAYAQQQVRLKIAHAGALSWRNNVGATPAKCPDCGAPRQPVRFGLANDSPQLNAKIKSHDLILAIPRTITPDMVGSRIAQFGSVEVKKPGWKYTGKGREAGQMAWASLIQKVGGFAAFSTGELDL